MGVAACNLFASLVKRLRIAGSGEGHPVCEFSSIGFGICPIKNGNGRDDSTGFYGLCVVNSPQNDTVGRRWKSQKDTLTYMLCSFVCLCPCRTTTAFPLLGSFVGC